MKYWKSIDELKDSTIKGKNRKTDEFSFYPEGSEIPDSSRRDFLKVLGFSVAVAAVAPGCEKVINKAIPYLNRPEEIIPGMANYYATTYFDGADYCSIVVKTREGRPIKIEGNKLSSITKGGTNARVQASVLSLYDSERLKQPLKDKSSTTWEQIDEEIIQKLNDISASNGSLVILTSSVISPSTKNLLAEFSQKYPTSKVVTYDPVSLSAMLEANSISFNKGVIPSYDFSKAETIVAFNADFLGTWLSPVEFTKQYVEKRKIKDSHTHLSHHIQFESGMSLTGSNADKRIQIKPSEELNVLLNIYKKLADIKGIPVYVTVSHSTIKIDEVCKKLSAENSSSLIVSGSTNVNIQLVVNAINQMLGNYGKTIDLHNHLNLKQSSDKEINELLENLNNGDVKGIILHNVNPVYDSTESERFISGIQNTELSIAITQTLDETASLAQYICPENHYLESWNDSEPKVGFYSLTQPTIQPLFETRQFQDSLLKWTGNESDFHNYMKNYWEKNIYPNHAQELNFTNFWNKSLQDGILESEIDESSAQPGFNISSLAKISNTDIANSKEFELVLYEKIGMGNGRHANNPWLQELPDPITRVCWDNYLSVSPSDAATHQLKDGDIVLINDKTEAPVIVQPGQAKGTLNLAIGYGRKNAGKAGNNVGVNAFLLAKDKVSNENWTFAEIKKIDKKHKMAQTQTHHSMEGRDFVKETTLEEHNSHHHEEHKHPSGSLYKGHKYEGHHWAMAIDLNSCTGCGNCVVSCQSENNIPVVGKEEVSRVHEMHWMRIDRYYTGDENNPEVVYLPMMCQHCDNAPCENVCPVFATSHSTEGLNQMTYNRCVGTRYCENNCPYKVRRFNWFDYTNSDVMKNNLHDPHGMTGDLKRMVLNPDVTVRAKGVIEKCSLCSQRIQEKKLKAKLENRSLEDGEIQTACSQSCPGNAIVFGDINNENSEISKLFKSKRKYRIIEEIHTEPSIGYLTKIRNK